MITWVTIYGPNGLKSEVVASSVDSWVSRGWSTEAPDGSGAPEQLRTPVAGTQSSDVTAPGESVVEGASPTTVEE